MLHKFRVQYILIDFSDNGFLVFSIFSLRFLPLKERLWLKADITTLVLSDECAAVERGKTRTEAPKVSATLLSTSTGAKVSFAATRRSDLP